MSPEETAAVEKALLLVTLGFLEATRAGVLHPHEAFHIVGIPRIFGRMEAYGVAPEVADQVSMLDEFPALKKAAGEVVWRREIGEAMDACKALLAAMPVSRERLTPVLRMFPMAGA
jgi:hypothetical protein